MMTNSYELVSQNNAKKREWSYILFIYFVLFIYSLHDRSINQCRENRIYSTLKQSFLRENRNLIFIILV